MIKRLGYFGQSNIFIAQIVVVLFLSSLSQAQDFYKGKAQGWHWYEDRVIDKKEDKQPLKVEPQAQVPASTLTPTPTQQIDAYKKDLEQKLHQALVSPTPEHVKAYMMAQIQGQEQAQRFSDAWMRVIYTHPELDYTATTPLNHVGRQIYDGKLTKTRQDKIKSLAKTHGLFFFYQSECGYCEAVAPVVKDFAEAHGFSVLAISLDGKALPEFPNFQIDNGIAQKFQITQTPALLAVNPKAGHVVPVSYGFVSRAEMEKRLDALLNSLPDERTQ
ncbi:MAG: type-F conjugative transfer system pilin assembly protein TraF [Janthinobacterium lividum]